MNLFAATWRVPGLSAHRLKHEMQRLASVYPTLDTGSIRHFGTTDGLLNLSMMSNQPASIAPRIYSHESRGALTLFCGLPVDPQNRCHAHDAASIDQHWDQVKDRFEGTYSIVRATKHPATLEIQTDLLGGEPVYYSRFGDGWIVSNSVLLIERLSTYRTLDAQGVSMLLCLGQVLGDRTLREGIRVLPPAERWRWTEDNSEPVTTNYCSLTSLVCRPRKKLRNLDFEKLGKDLEAPLVALSDEFGALSCPLTGGKDSRVVAALAMRAGVDARYSTFGNAEGDDVRIAAKIAMQFGLPHDIINISESDVESNWDDSCLPSIRATDGMRSLYLLAGVLKPLSNVNTAKEIYLWGACGEVARSFYGRLPIFKNNTSDKDVIALVRKGNPDGSYQLTRSEAQGIATTWLEETIADYVQQGIALQDIPDIYGTFMIDGRRLGNNGRALAGYRDTFTPFATRAFFEATFSLSPMQRNTEPLHYGLVRHLVPALHGIELAQDNWYQQNALLRYIGQSVNDRMNRYVNGIRRRTQRFNRSKSSFSHDDSTFHRVTWFESQRSKIRELALDSGASPVWDFIDKDRFERIMSDKESPMVRSRCLKLLFHIATLVYYQCDDERKEKSGPTRSLDRHGLTESKVAPL